MSNTEKKINSIDLQREIAQSDGRRLFYEYIKSEYEDPDGLLKKFDELTKMYFEVNAVINISALRTVNDVYIKHYLDSIVPCKYFSPGTVCDVGCGGGFPTIPLAIVAKNQITGLDSVGKKLLLVRRCITELKLNNLKADYARSEEIVKMGKEYDVTCARALADTDKALSLCAPLTKFGGKIILYKTQTDAAARNDVLKKTNSRLIDVIDYTLYNTDIKRRLFIYQRFKH